MELLDNGSIENQEWSERGSHGIEQQASMPSSNDYLIGTLVMDVERSWKQSTQRASDRNESQLSKLSERVKTWETDCQADNLKNFEKSWGWETVP